MRNRSLLVPAAVLALALGLSGCGRGPDSAPAAPVTASTQESSSAAVPPVSQSEAARGSSSPPPAASPGTCISAQQLAALPLRKQLAQLLMVGVDPSGSAQARDVVAQGVGGIFIGGTSDTLLTSGELQKLESSTPLGLMVAVDEEGGRVQRVDNLVGSVPSARVMAATMSVAQVHDLAVARGSAMRKLGITVDFAPDADVSDQAAGTVIGDRSFSADPAEVTAYAGAFADGLREAGVLPVLKHFPGHGAASGDSHKGAVTTPPLSALQARDLVPFRQLVSSAPAVMLGHLDVPGLSESGVPTSLSPAAVSLLRDGSGYDAPAFDGLILTDDLEGMAAITDTYDLPHATLNALVAGVDLALFITPRHLSEVLDVLEQAVAQQKLSTQRVQDALRHVLAAKGIALC